MLRILPPMGRQVTKPRMGEMRRGFLCGTFASRFCLRTDPPWGPVSPCGPVPGSRLCSHEVPWRLPTTHHSEHRRFILLGFPRSSCTWTKGKNPCLSLFYFQAPQAVASECELKQSDSPEPADGRPGTQESRARVRAGVSETHYPLPLPCPAPQPQLKLTSPSLSESTSF